MTYTLAMSADDEALIERYAARERLSVPDFMLRATKEMIEQRVHVPRPKSRDEMTDEEFEAMIERSMEDARQGRVMPADEMFAKIYKKYGLHAL